MSTHNSEGWHDALSDLARAGVEAFNQGEFFQQHEFFEDAWKAELRPVRVAYQGILQVGVACYQIQQGNYRGTIRMFQRGLAKLIGLPDTVQGINVHRFRQESEIIYRQIVNLGPARLHEFDQSQFPRLYWQEMEREERNP